MLRTKVSSDIADLQALHARVGWTPGAEHVRPDPSTRAQKEMLIANLGRMWASQADWVHHTFFGARATRGADGRRVAERAAPTIATLAEQPFPYKLPEGTRHMVLWCSSARDAWSDEAITAAIARAVDERDGGEFVWCAMHTLPARKCAHCRAILRRATPRHSRRYEQQLSVGGTVD